MYNKILAILLLIFDSSHTDYSMKDLCFIWSGTGHIGDPDDCEKWGYCKDNHLVAEGHCPNGQLYNYLDGTCKLVIDVSCLPKQEELCAHRQLSDYVADVTNCSIYRRCEDVEKRQFQCPKGELFSNRLQKCIRVEDNRCPQSLDLCSKMQNGSLLRDPIDCRNYWLCVNGVGRQLRCSAGRYFNPQTTHCQTIRPEHCLSLDDDINPQPPLPPQTDNHVCPKYYKTDRLSGPQFFTDDLTCYGYYVCKSQFDIGQWQKCPLGLHFQWWSEKCVPAENYSCPFDRCGNLYISMVSIINTGCKEYTECSFDKSIRMEKCPKQYPYFDETSGYCISDFPNHKVCFMDG